MTKLTLAVLLDEPRVQSVRSVCVEDFSWPPSVALAENEMSSRLSLTVARLQAKFASVAVPMTLTFNLTQNKDNDVYLMPDAPSDLALTGLCSTLGVLRPTILGALVADYSDTVKRCSGPAVKAFAPPAGAAFQMAVAPKRPRELLDKIKSYLSFVLPLRVEISRLVLLADVPAGRAPVVGFVPLGKAPSEAVLRVARGLPTVGQFGLELIEQKALPMALRAVRAWVERTRARNSLPRRLTALLPLLATSFCGVAMRCDVDTVMETLLAPYIAKTTSRVRGAAPTFIVTQKVGRRNTVKIVTNRDEVPKKGASVKVSWPLVNVPAFGIKLKKVEADVASLAAAGAPAPMDILRDPQRALRQKLLLWLFRVGKAAPSTDGGKTGMLRASQLQKQLEDACAVRVPVPPGRLIEEMRREGVIAIDDATGEIRFAEAS